MGSSRRILDPWGLCPWMGNWDFSLFIFHFASKLPLTEKLWSCQVLPLCTTHHRIQNNKAKWPHAEASRVWAKTNFLPSPQLFCRHNGKIAVYPKLPGLAEGKTAATMLNRMNSFWFPHNVEEIQALPKLGALACILRLIESHSKIGPWPKQYSLVEHNYIITLNVNKWTKQVNGEAKRVKVE